MRRIVPVLLVAALAACGTKVDPVQAIDPGPVAPGISYCRDAKPVYDRWCTSCHASTKLGAARGGAPASIDYDSYAAASKNAQRGLGRMSNGSMPPGGGVPSADVSVVAGWIQAGAPDCPVPADDVPAVDPGVDPGDDPGTSDPGPADPGGEGTASVVSYCRDLKPILDARCISCHGSQLAGAARNGAPAGIDYDTWAVASASATAGNARVQAGTMPPGAGLPAAERQAFQAWVDAGAQDCPATGDDTGPVTDPGPPADVPVVACSTGQYWSPAGEGDAWMRPGGNCIGCHAQQRAAGEDGAPVLAVAGTVMGAVHDVDDCIGVAGATVALKGKDGTVTTLAVTNASGNFLAYAGTVQVVLPYTATVTKGGATNAMTGERSDLNCMNCHTKAGASYAPGRIVLP